MEPLEFLELVRDMRASQKEYFRTRSRGVLGESKSLERQVDSYIAEVIEALKDSFELED